MNAHRAPDIVEPFGDPHHPFELRQPGADGKESSDPGAARAFDDRVELGPEGIEVQMAMAIDQHGRVYSVARA